MPTKKILIIEDSTDLADSLEDILRLKGYSTLKAPDGRTGVELAITEKPDLILLDIRLPDIDGLDILKEIRSDNWGGVVKILILTASDLPEVSIPELGIAANDIIHKSHWSIKDIFDRIEEELQK